MNEVRNRNFNSTLALLVAVTCGILTICLLIALYLWPRKTLDVIDGAELKLVLLWLGLCIITTIGAFTYTMFHTPSVKRLALKTFKLVALYLFLSVGFSVFGWPQLQSISAEAGQELDVKFHLAEVSHAVWPTLATCFAALLFASGMYTLIGFIEETYKINLSD